MVNALTDRFYRLPTVLNADPVIHAGQVRLTVQHLLIDIVDPVRCIINIVYHFALLIIRMIAELHVAQNSEPPPPAFAAAEAAAASFACLVGAYSKPSADPARPE